MWLPLEADAVAGEPLLCPPVDVELLPEDPPLWLGLELCPLSDELVEWVLDELEMLGELELGEERSGVDAGAGELWIEPAPAPPPAGELDGLDGMLGAFECCAKTAAGTKRRLAVTR